MGSQRKDILDREQEIRQWIKEERTKGFICKQLNCRYSTLNSYLKIMNIEYEGVRGFPFGSSQRLTFDEYIKLENTSSSKIRIKLIQENYKSHKCESCGIEKWLGKDISLELHHIDGNHHNNKLENLQILCPNCHSQTPNFRQRKDKKTYKCTRCTETITKQSKTGLCKTCCNRRSRVVQNRKTKIKWPTMEELIARLEKSNYSKLSRELGVTDNAIRKHMKRHMGIKLSKVGLEPTHSLAS